jgi:transposase
LNLINGAARAVLFHLEVSNDKRGIEQFIKQIKLQYKDFSVDKCLFCMEHTGIYRSGEP